MVEPTRGLRRKGHQHVDSAFGPKIIAENGTENCKLVNLPAPAKDLDPVFRNSHAILLGSLTHRSSSSSRRLKLPSRHFTPGVALSPLISASSNGPSDFSLASRKSLSTTGSKSFMSLQRMSADSPF